MSINNDIITVIFNYCNTNSIYKLRFVNKKYNDLYNDYYEIYKKKYDMDELFDDLQNDTNINWVILKKDIIMKKKNWNHISKYKNININFIDTFQNLINWNLYLMWNVSNTQIIQKYKHNIDWDIVTIYQPFSLLKNNENIQKKINLNLLFLNKNCK